jgi:predicted transcriptional regulator
MPGGRPPFKITKEVLTKVETLASRGLTQQQIADALGIHVGTLCEKKNQFNEFNEAIKSGQAKGISTVANQLFENAKNGDNTAAIFYLKNRAGWADKVEQEITGKDGKDFNVKIEIID